MNKIILPKVVQERVAMYRAMDNDAKFSFWLQVIVLAAALAIYAVPGLAHAAAWDTESTTILSTLTGTAMTTLAVIAVVILGVTAMFGKMSWAWAGSIIGGIILIFGGADIVNLIKGAA